MNVPPKDVLSQLVKKGIIKHEKADQIELDSFRENLPIVDFLFKRTDIKKAEILQILSELLHVPYVDVTSIAIEPQSLGFVSEAIARKYNIIPVIFDTKTNTITIATSEPLDITITDFLERKTGKRIVLALGYLDDIVKTIDIAYTQSLSPEVKEALKEVELPDQTQTLEIKTTIKEAPISKIVNTLLEFAVKSRASDIHIEAEESRTKVRYRIDGLLYEKISLPRGIHDALISSALILKTLTRKWTFVFLRSPLPGGKKW